VRRTVESGCLSGFYGSWGDQFLGGPLILEFEAAWSARFSVAHTVSVNSATSGLCAAVGAVGAKPGDEVIVPPYTMSATAMAPLVYGATPVFADIEPDTFCIDPASEGFPHGLAYVRPLYMLPLFQRDLADGFAAAALRGGSFAAGICPVGERMHGSNR
jgi:hypothetical protein